MAGQARLEFATSKAILSGHGTSEEAYSLNYFLEQRLRYNVVPIASWQARVIRLLGSTRQPISLTGSPPFAAPASPSRSMALRYYMKVLALLFAAAPIIPIVKAYAARFV